MLLHAAECWAAPCTSAYLRSPHAPIPACLPPPQIIPNTEVVVGDVMLVDTGDKIIADGVMIDGHHLVRAAGWGY